MKKRIPKLTVLAVNYILPFFILDVKILSELVKHLRILSFTIKDEIYMIKVTLFSQKINNIKDDSVYLNTQNRPLYQ